MTSLSFRSCLKRLFFGLCLLGELVTAGSPARETGWRPIGISGGGGLFTPAISAAEPDLMMLNCDMSAAYISEDGGRHWRMIPHAQLRSGTACRPAFHPTDPNILYAASGGRLKISRDRGKTFAPIGHLEDSVGGEIAINPSDAKIMLAGSRSGGCQLSRDGGETWAACQGPAGRVIAFHFDRTRQGRSMVAATDRSIWRSDDGGQTWAEKTQGLPWKEIQGFAGASDKNLVMLYCSVRSQDENGVFRGGLYRSRDRGETWESAMGQGLNTETKKADQWAYGSISQYNQPLATDAKPLTVYAFNTSTGFHPPHSDTVCRSDDGGATWRATYFQDPRFTNCNVAPDWETASCGQCFKGGETPFGVSLEAVPDFLGAKVELAQMR